MRLKIMYIDSLQKHIDHQEILHEDATTNEQKEVIQRLLLRLRLTRIKFKECIQEYPQVQLTPEDIKDIDAELDARMETLETDYKNGLKNQIKLENGSKFHKYQAILKEEKDIINRFFFLCSDDKERTEDNFIEKCFKKINVIKGPFGEENPEETIKFYQMEIMAARIRKDKELKKFIDNNERVFFLDLMKLKFFPVTPDADPMDAVYNQFISISEDYNFIATERRKAGK
ncbi:hypothetical protein CAEBREN_15071 [Caenorhabditis brenneri]|uniref:Uncharacterized protein n=1 Tax=Caenorhabditis brenneri TaxID=135651 RepID=G0NSG5_CAEBE|nr:hypothetical protein CAEBREN_15071 [Caenorhabditis brenneri]